MISGGNKSGEIDGTLTLLRYELAKVTASSGFKEESCEGVVVGYGLQSGRGVTLDIFFIRTSS
jgi:hypothetical protein